MLGKLNAIEKVGVSLIVLINLAGLIISLVNKEFFVSVYVREDGVVEYGTAVFFFIASLVALKYLVNLRSAKKGWFLITTSFIVVLFIFVSGEEISWGQRIIGVESSEFFEDNNAQGETNLHNLKIYGVKINKLLFGPFLSVCILIYMVVLPVVYDKNDKFRDFVNSLYIPLPKFPIVASFVLGALIITIIQASKKWELLELMASIAALLIIAYPKNDSIYKVR